MPTKTNWISQFFAAIAAAFGMTPGTKRNAAAVPKPATTKASAKAKGLAGAAAAVALATTALIMPFEGRELRAYYDIVGVPTICWGETRGVHIGDVATPEECDNMLAQAVGEYARGIEPCLPADLPTKSRAAFISAAYNIGVAGFCKSSMAKWAKTDLPRACEALMAWNKGRIKKGGPLVAIKGLTRRRAAERDLCLEGARG